VKLLSDPAVLTVLSSLQKGKSMSTIEDETRAALTQSGNQIRHESTGHSGSHMIPQTRSDAEMINVRDLLRAQAALIAAQDNFVRRNDIIPLIDAQNGLIAAQQEILMQLDRGKVAELQVAQITAQTAILQNLGII
jgi:hypothetical protein